MSESVSPVIGSANRRRIIIVDDNYAVADALKWALEAAGHCVVGMASSIATATELIEQTACDIAILDVDLRGETTEAVALRLAALATPFMFITGFGDIVELPPELVHVPLLDKPADPDEILRTISVLCPCLE